MDFMVDHIASLTPRARAFRARLELARAVSALDIESFARARRQPTGLQPSEPEL